MIEEPKISELTPEEKDIVIAQILHHLGKKVQTFKLDGESRRDVYLVRTDDN